MLPPVIHSSDVFGNSYFEAIRSLDEFDGIAYNTIIVKMQIVIDTDVFISALRSNKGASYKLLTLSGSDKFEINVSVALILEYEYVAKRIAGEITLAENDIDDIIDYICLAANKRKVFYLWRPVLKDPNDDMVLELAAGANCDFIITFNKKDFRHQDLKLFGIKALTPEEFLREIGELS